MRLPKLLLAAMLCISPLAVHSPAAAVDCPGPYGLDTNDAMAPGMQLKRDASTTAFARTLGFLPCEADNVDYWTITWIKGIEATTDFRMKSPAGENYNLFLFDGNGTRIGTRTAAGAGGTERVVFSQPLGYDSYVYARVTPHSDADWSSTEAYILRYNTNPE